MLLSVAREEVVTPLPIKSPRPLHGCTDKKALLKVNITDMDAECVAIEQDMSSSCVCTVLLLGGKGLSCYRTCYRQTTPQIPRKDRCPQVLSPEEEFGQIEAERLTNPNLVSTYNYLIIIDCVYSASANHWPDTGNISLMDKNRLSLITVKSIQDEGSHIEGVVDYEFRIENFIPWWCSGYNRDHDRL